MVSKRKSNRISPKGRPAPPKLQPAVVERLRKATGSAQVGKSGGMKKGRFQQHVATCMRQRGIYMRQRGIYMRQRGIYTTPRGIYTGQRAACTGQRAACTGQRAACTGQRAACTG